MIPPVLNFQLTLIIQPYEPIVNLILLRTLPQTVSFRHKKSHLRSEMRLNTSKFSARQLSAFFKPFHPQRLGQRDYRVKGYHYRHYQSQIKSDISGQCSYSAFQLWLNDPHRKNTAHSEKQRISQAYVALVIIFHMRIIPPSCMKKLFKTPAYKQLPCGTAG